MIYCFLNLFLAKKVLSQILIREFDSIDTIPVDFENEATITGSGDSEIFYEEELFVLDRNK